VSKNTGKTTISDTDYEIDVVENSVQFAQMAVAGIIGGVASLLQRARRRVEKDKGNN
jgi:hypothetical protein